MLLVQILAATVLGTAAAVLLLVGALALYIKVEGDDSTDY